MCLEISPICYGSKNGLKSQDKSTINDEAFIIGNIRVMNFDVIDVPCEAITNDRDKCLMPTGRLPMKLINKITLTDRISWPKEKKSGVLHVHQACVS